MVIEHYDFGEIVIDGRAYTRDLKIIDGRVLPDWWRQEAHTLHVKDLEDVFEARPEVLIVGTGSSGLMAISEEVVARLARQGIELMAKPTSEACKVYNSAVLKRRAAFVAHLTC